MIEYKIQSWLIDGIVEVARESTNEGFNEHNATREAETLVENLVKKLTIPVVVGTLFCDDCQKWVEKECVCGNKDLKYDATY